MYLEKKEKNVYVHIYLLCKYTCDMTYSVCINKNKQVVIKLILMPFQSEAQCFTIIPIQFSSYSWIKKAQKHEDHLGLFHFTSWEIFLKLQSPGAFLVIFE